MSILACMVTRISKTCGLQMDKRTTDCCRICHITGILLNNTTIDPVYWDTVTWLRTDGKREHKNLCILLLLFVNMADPRLLTPNLPANRLQCPDCKAFRSITDFPFQRTGFRKLLYIHCKIWRANRQQQIQIQKTQQESSKGQVLADPLMIFCSSYNQQQPNT
jgi:hypothetical protein